MVTESAMFMLKSKKSKKSKAWHIKKREVVVKTGEIHKVKDWGLKNLEGKRSSRVTSLSANEAPNFTQGPTRSWGKTIP